VGSALAEDDKPSSTSAPDSTSPTSPALQTLHVSAGATPDQPPGAVPEATPEATPEFLAGFGADTTDVFETPAASLGSVKAERQLILTVLAGPQMGWSRVVDRGELVVGRGEGSDLVLNDQGLSRRHCKLVRQGQELFIEDLDSSNGTFVDGALVRGRTPLQEGARIHLGRHTVLSLARRDPLEQMAARQLYESSMRDPLTDLHNRRFFDQRLREEFAFATRHQAPLSVILLDLDHFKKVNDTWGHPAGDEVLRQVASLIKRCVRKEDVASRFGGEEFGVVVRTESHEGARAVAERMRKRLEDTSIAHQGNLILVTISAGVATAAPPHLYESPTALLAAADQALYRAKAAGRNRIEG
jgi:two-component system, cell cycle response regulator